MIYDELEGKEAVTWSYLLHTVELPMEIQELTDEVKVTGRNKAGGISVAHLFSSAKTEQAMVDTFFCAPTNWKNVTNAQGKAVKYPNHWHFTATSEKAQVYRFATVINTHALKYPAKDPEILSDGRIKVGGWLISVNLKSDGAPSFFIRSTQEKVNITYKGEATVINEDGYETVMRDTVPELEI